MKYTTSNSNADFISAIDEAKLRAKALVIEALEENDYPAVRTAVNALETYTKAVRLFHKVEMLEIRWE